MGKKVVGKVSDKLAKVDESFSVFMHDNGFLFEISGRDHSDEWATAKIQVSSIEKLVELIKESTDMERS